MVAATSQFKRWASFAEESSRISLFALHHGILVAATACFFWGCGASEPPTACCSGRRGTWNTTATWPSQHDARRLYWREVSRVGDVSQLSGQSQRDLVESLRSAAVLGVDREYIADVGSEDPWQARLMASSVSLHSSGRAAIAQLEVELEASQNSFAPGARVWEAAVRSNLVTAMVQDGIERRLKGAEKRENLESAMRLIDGYCLVPEAMLNKCAIYLELAESSWSRADEVRRLGQLASAREVLDEIEFGDATSCGSESGEFFGAAGIGERFVYVLDKSGSMRTSGGFDRLKYRVLQTISGLPDGVAFAIFFFSEVWESSNGIFEATDEFLEIPVPVDRSDGQGMFLRSKLGERGEGGGMDDLSDQIDAVQPDGSTYAVRALERAIDLKPTTIFLLTDGELFDDHSEILRIASRVRPLGFPINPVLFISPTSDSPDALEAMLSPLRALSHETGGVLTIVRNGNRSALDLDSGLDVNFGGGESIRDRATRIGSWTSACERQYWHLRAELAFQLGEYQQAELHLEHSMMPAKVDLVTGAPPMQDRVQFDWPRLRDGSPMPSDGMAIFKSAIALFLDGDADQAIKRFDAAAKVWGTCARSADERGNSPAASRFADLACKSVLFGAMAAGDRSSVAAEAGYARATELGVARSAGWNRQLLAAGGGFLEDLRARIAIALWSGDDVEKARVELGLARAFFRDSGRRFDPANILGFDDLSDVERRFFSQLRRDIQALEQQ